MTGTTSTTISTKKLGTVLVVDDEPLNRELLEDLLSEEFDILSAANGPQALKYIEEAPCDIVLLDINMPGMDGFMVLERIRQTHTHMDLPVIFLSALVEPQYIVKGLKLGANDYVAKPISPAVLSARVHTQIELKRLHDERSTYIERLESAEQMRLQLTRIASHDLKNPLNNLKIAHTLLKEQLREQIKLQPVVDAVKVNVDTMIHVIDAFLDMVALQTDSIALKIEPIPLRDVVRNVVLQYELTAEKKSIKLELGALDGIACGDSKRMVQVLSNLVSNAIKYSPPQTTVRLWIEQRGNYQTILVADEGVGVPEDERHLLFKEFSKLTPRPTAGEESTGLGLWIVRHLMQRQNGDAGAEFPNPRGSTFWVALPQC